MVLTHNYYVDFLKAFNSFLMKTFNNQRILSYSNVSINKIEYNIGSKTILSHQLYGNESYEYPNIMVNLNDIRIDEGISSISRNIYGRMNSLNTQFLAYNETTNDEVYLESKKYILNFDVKINVESNSDLLNFYHTVTNYLPLNFTFVDFSFMYFVNLSDYAKALNWSVQDNFTNIILFNPENGEEVPRINYKDEVFYGLTEVQPELEITSITKMEDKEEMKYSLNLNILASLPIPFLIYSNKEQLIERIIIDVDLGQWDNTEYDYPIFLDIDADLFKTERITSGILLKNEEIIIDDNNKEIIIDSDILREKIKDFNDLKSYGLYLIDNYYDQNSKRIFLPTEKPIIKTDDNSKEVIVFQGSYYDNVKNFFATKQYNRIINRFYLLKFD